MLPIRAPVVFAFAVLLLGLPLAGCVDTVGQAKVAQVAAEPKIARRPGVSPHGASVALASVQGAPQDVLDRFASGFAEAAALQDMSTVDPAKAHYLARAYIDAAEDQPGVTRFSYVLDLFDRSKKRVARLTDQVAVKGASADPWSLADDTALRALADRGAGDLADALTNTPEAVAASAVASATGAGSRNGAAQEAEHQSSETRVSQSGTSIAPRTAASEPETRLGFAAAR